VKNTKQTVISIYLAMGQSRSNDQWKRDT